jgi:thiol:disulfide interchange protein
LADRVRARLTAAEGRKFAFTVGIAFLVLAAAIYLLRQHLRAPAILGGIGAVLIVAGVVSPTRLGPLQRGWMGFAHLLSKITTPIFMGIVYFLVLTPIGLLRRAFGHDALVRRPKDGSYWIARAEGKAGRSDLKRQF